MNMAAAPSSCGTRADWASDDDDPGAALARGALKFSLHGKRLGGGWALIRLRRDNGKNWLLVKEKDEWARPGSDDDDRREKPRPAW